MGRGKWPTVGERGLVNFITVADVSLSFGECRGGDCIATGIARSRKQEPETGWVVLVSD